MRCAPFLSSLKWGVYSLLFTLVYLLLLPHFLLRMKKRGGYRARLADRFGVYPPEICARVRELQNEAHAPLIWIHAVSVGEVQVAGQLMRALRAENPSVHFVFSTTSSTGWKMAEKEVTPEDVLIYNPLDFVTFVSRALNQIKPHLVILTETEIWPQFIRLIHARRIPLVLANARISDRSAPRYRFMRPILGEIFRAFTRIYAQSDLDAARLRAAGAQEAHISVTGSFKFDVAHRNPVKERELARWLGSGEIFLGASTWPGEDEVLLRMWSHLRTKYPQVKLVLAPRHFEKAPAVVENIRKAGFACVRRSLGEEVHASSQPTVFLCDTTGELMGLYGLATVVFVGKSLCAHGSQNMIEPCLCAKPTLVGPYTENFRPVMSDLLSAHAILQVQNEQELQAAIEHFFDEPHLRTEQGARAEQAVLRRQGVVARCAHEILQRLSAQEKSCSST